MKQRFDPKFLSGIKLAIFILIPISIFSFIFWKDWDSIGTTEDEAYIYPRDRKVLDFSFQQGNIQIKPVLEGCTIKVSDIEFISRNFPPIFSLKISNYTIPVLVWPHITYLTYLPQDIAVKIGDKIKIKELIVCEKFLNFVITCLTIMVIFLIAKKLYGEFYAFISALIYSTFASTKFFSLIGISIDFLFHTLYMWLSILFILKFREEKGKKYLIISSVFCGLCILSYLKFSSWGFLILLSALAGKQRIKDTATFSIIPGLLFLIFYIIPSVLVQDCSERYSINVLSSTINLISGASKFQSILLEENLELIYEDIFRMIDISGYGYRLAYHDNLEFRIIPSIPFVLAFLHNLLKRETRVYAVLFLIYDLLLYFELPFLGFHRKLRPLMPAIALILGKFFGDLILMKTEKGKNKKIALIFAGSALLLMHFYFQFEKAENFTNKLKREGKWSIQTNLAVQKKLLDHILEAKRDGVKIANLSAAVNLDLLSNTRRIIDYDFSYIVHFSKSYLLQETSFWESALLSICQMPEKIYILADELTYNFLREKPTEKLAEIDGIFFIFKCKDKENSENIHKRD